jgi:hypothetical protein
MGTCNSAVKEGAMQFFKSLALFILNAGLLVFPSIGSAKW